MAASPHQIRIGTLYFIFSSAIALGQSATTSEPVQTGTNSTTAKPVTTIQTTVRQFDQEQRILGAQEEAMRASGATWQQIQTWRKKSASVIALQEKRLQALAMVSALKLQQENIQPKVPDDASPAMKAFLINQAALSNAEAHTRNQIVQLYASSGASMTFAQLAQMHRQEDKLALQQNASLIAQQTQRVQALANASAAKVRSLPEPVAIPANASPQEAQFLADRHQLMMQTIQIQNQYAQADPIVRAAALRKYFKDNLARMEQVRQESIALAPVQSASSTPTTGSN